MVVEDAHAAKHAMRLAVVPHEVIAGQLADAVSAARHEGRLLGLRGHGRPPEHLARSGEVEAAILLKLQKETTYSIELWITLIGLLSTIRLLLK